MITVEKLKDMKYENPVIIEPPTGALERLGKALAKATKEGRGERTLADLQITFFNADSPFPGTKNTQTYACIETGSGGEPLISGYAAWRPQGPPGEPGVELYDCYEVANEINTLT